MADFSIIVQCSECGKTLDDSLSADRWGNPIIEVTPCPACIDEAYNKGEEAGST